MKMKRTVALLLSTLLMLTLLLALSVMPARASGAEVFLLEMGNESTSLFVSNYKQKIVYIGPSFTVSFSQTADSWCKYDPATPNRLTLIKSATITGYISAANGAFDIYIENGVTLTLNATNNMGDSTECVGIRIQRGALSFFGASGESANKGAIIINNASKNAGGATYTTNAAIYAKYCSGVSLSGGCAVTATGGDSQSWSYGVYLYGDNTAATLSLAEGSSLIAETGGTSKEPAGVYVYGEQDALIHVSGGSRLNATGRDASSDGRLGSRGVNLASEKKAHMLVEGAGSKLTGTSGSAPSGNSYGVCIEVFGAIPSLLQIKAGGEVTGTGGNGYSSYGIYVGGGTDAPSILVEEGGVLTGTGGALGANNGAGWSFGVYSYKSISVSGKLTGNGGDAIYSQDGFSAHSYGVFSSTGTITVDGGELTGNGGAATAQGATAEVCGVRARGIILTGDQAVLKGVNQKASTANMDSRQSIALSYGVYSEGAITVGSACELVGTAGSASGVADSYSYGVYSDGTIDATGSLTGVGKSAQKSFGVCTNGHNLSVSGSLSGTGDALSEIDTVSYGVSTGRGKVTISGTVNATANGADAGDNCIGMSAGGGVELTGNGRLTAQTASATPDNRHCAKIPKDGVGSNALTAGANAVWRGGSTAAFEALAATYDDAVARAYLEVRNNPAVKVAPASVSVNAGEEVTLTAQGVADNDDISWYTVNSASSYSGASVLLGETAKTLIFTPGSDHQTKYYFAKLVLNNDTFCSNIVPVTARTYGIELMPKNDYRFPGATVGYTAAPEAREVMIKNTGNAPTGSVAVTLSGTNADSFVLQGDSFADILAGKNASFTVQPKTNLGEGVYTATVTVGPAQGNPNPIVAQSFAVSFTVEAALLPTVEITPRDHFVKGDAPTLTMIVGHGLPGLTVSNLSGVAVTVGGVRTALDRDVHYEAFTGGSIHIAPKVTWLNTLKPGDYSVDIALEGGAYEGVHVSTRFTVTAPPPPATGDSASPVLWLCLMAGAALALWAILWARRKAKATERNR